MAGLEAAEMRFLRIVKGYTRLDKIRSEVKLQLDQHYCKAAKHG
jgi:hypothetical protein